MMLHLAKHDIARSNRIVTTLSPDLHSLPHIPYVNRQCMSNCVHSLAVPVMSEASVCTTMLPESNYTSVMLPVYTKCCRCGVTHRYNYHITAYSPHPIIQPVIARCMPLSFAASDCTFAMWSDMDCRSRSTWVEPPGTTTTINSDLNTLHSHSYIMNT